jgi:hypothetical protein
MSDSVLQGYLAGLADPRAARLITALDRVIRRTQPDLQTAVKYKILTYGLKGDFRTFVCALDLTKKGVALRFLYGVMLSDPLHVLRGGSSVLMTWDIPLDAEIDEAAVSAYVAEAVAKYGDYKTNRPAVQEVAYAAAEKAGRRPRGTGRRP